MLSPTEYDALDALAMAELVRRGQVSAAELCGAAVARAEVVNLAINAIITPLYAEAAKQAHTLTGPLAGVPFLIKDFGAQLAGVRQASGSRALLGHVPQQDDELVRRWKRAGLNPIGKTNLPEFALLGITEPEAFGPTRNPWNLNHTAGGSSGGSAAAVAAGIVPIAGAGDGGGSIRIPASCCALFGLKPSRGRVPSGPSAGEPWHGAAVEHVLTRSVRDSAALLDLTQGPDVGAPLMLPPPQRPYLAEVGREPPALRIGFSTAHPLDQPVHPECVQAVQEAAKLLGGLGHHVEEVPLPFDGHALARAFLMLYFGDTGATVAGLRRELGRPARGQDVEAVTWLLARLGQSYSAADFAASRQSWNDHARALGRFHQRYDLLLTPTLAVPPMRVGELEPTGAERVLLEVNRFLNLGPLLKRSGLIDELATTTLAKTPFTQLANLTGTPAMSVPLHWTGAGLPVGVQFVAPLAREDKLLQLAGQLERARPWFGRRPAFS